MSKSRKIRTILYRRKRIGKTDYKKRLALLKNKSPRLVIRRFNKNIIAQIISYEENGDKIEAQAHSKELEKLGWKGSKNNVPASYLVGMLLAKKSKAKNAILDVGLQQPTKGSRIYACLKGAVDGGIKVPHSPEVLPKIERIEGKHIEGKDMTKAISEIKQKIKG